MPKTHRTAILTPPAGSGELQPAIPAVRRRQLVLPRQWPAALLALLLFASVFALLALCHGSRLVLQTSDEGIILDGSERLLRGQRLYADFFGYMSPGSYWIQELVFRVLGVSLLAGRIPVLFDTALQCALVFWLGTSLLSRRAAFICAAFFLWMQTWDPTMITAQHRHDSAALALAAVCCAWQSRAGATRWWLLASGALAAAAALCTPSTALAGAAILVWIAYDFRVRRSALAWIGGSAATLAIATAVLWQEGVLPACVDQMLWLQQHYTAVNVMFYGAVNGAYRALLGQAAAADLLMRCFILFWVLLPALVPIIAVVAGLTWMMRMQHDERRHSLATLLTVSTAALATSALPRMDVAHLDWVIAIPFLMAFAAVARLRNGHVQGVILAIFCFASLLFVPRWINNFTGQDVATPAGMVRAAAADRTEISALLKNVHASASLYVHPDMPLLYFLTQAHNPTRYSCLPAGMMTDSAADDTLRTLQRDPPAWVLYLHANPSEYLGLFPAADPDHIRYGAIEDWIARHYEAAGVRIAGYDLLRQQARK